MAEKWNYVLGVDAGGSKTEAWVAKVEEGSHTDPYEVVGRETAGSGNLLTAPEKAMGNVKSAIEAAIADAGIECSASEPLQASCFCMAGAGRQEVSQEWQAWAKSLPFLGQVRVMDDVDAVFRAGCPSGSGIAIIAGTGSIAVGRKSPESERLRCGGWGPLIGDQGSGYWLGKQLLHAASWHEDGRRDCQELYDAVLKHFHVERFTDLIPQIQKLDRGEVAQLSRLLFELAQSTNADAIAIVSLAVNCLSDLIMHLIDRIKWREKIIEIGLAGGLLENSQFFRELFSTKLEEQMEKLELRATTYLVEKPVSGAVLLAAEEVQR